MEYELFHSKAHHIKNYNGLIYNGHPVGNETPDSPGWNEYFDETNYKEGDTKEMAINNLDFSSVKITEAIPNAKSGVDLYAKDYPKFFTTETKPVVNGKVTFILSKNPVFVEEK